MPVIHSADEEFHLSHEEEEKLNQFQLITAFADDELPLVIKLLQNHSWRLENALSRYFDDDTWKQTLTEGTPAIPERLPEPVQQINQEQSIQNNDDTFMPFVINQSNLVPNLPIVTKLPADYKDRFQIVGLDKSSEDDFNYHPILVLIMLLPKALVKLGVGVFSFLWNIITFGLTSNNLLNKDTVASKVPKAPISTDILELPPIEDSLKGILKDDSPRLLNYQTLKSFNEAFDHCQETFKYLLLVFVGNISRDTPESIDVNSERFLKQVLTDNSTYELLEERKDQMVLYIGTVQDPELWSVAKKLNVRFTPECLLIGNVLNNSGSLNGVTRMSVLNRLKLNSPNKFRNSLKLTMDRYNPEMIVNRTEQEELKLARHLKQMQDEAYEQSLKQDQIKEEKRRLEQEQEKAEKEIELQKERQLKLKETINNLQWLKNCTDLLSKDDTNGGEKVATLQIRTSDGKRMIKKYSSSTSLYSIYVSVGSHLYLNETDTDIHKITSAIQNKIHKLHEDNSVLCFKDDCFVEDEMLQKSGKELTKSVEEELDNWKDLDGGESQIEFNFELVSPFPRYNVPIDKETAIVDCSQLWPNGNLLVEFFKEESDDEESDEESGEDGNE